MDITTVALLDIVLAARDDEEDFSKDSYRDPTTGKWCMTLDFEDDPVLFDLLKEDARKRGKDLCQFINYRLMVSAHLRVPDPGDAEAWEWYREGELAKRHTPVGNA